MPRLRIDPALPAPLWSQIEEGMRLLVASGGLGPGAPAPSVRELARTLRVNPATVVRAYQRLIEQGVLESRRGDGTYVSQAPPQPSRLARARGLSEAAERYVSQAALVGASRKEAEAALRAAWGRNRGEERP